MAMNMETCKAQLNAKIEELNTLISKKWNEFKLRRNGMSVKEALKKLEDVRLEVYDAEVYQEQLKMALEMIDDEAEPEDKAEIVDMCDVENRADKFWYSECNYNEVYVRIYWCEDWGDSDKSQVTWIIGLLTL